MYIYIFKNDLQVPRFRELLDEVRVSKGFNCRCVGKHI